MDAPRADSRDQAAQPNLLMIIFRSSESHYCKNLSTRPTCLCPKVELKRLETNNIKKYICYVLGVSKYVKYSKVNSINNFFF